MRKLIVLLFVSLLLGSLGLTYFYLPKLLQPIATHFLEPYDLILDTLTLERPGLTHTQVHSVRMRYQTQDYKISLNMNTLAIAYPGLSFLSTTRLDRIDIEELQLNIYQIKAPQKTATASDEKVTIPADIIQQFFSQLPFNDLSIQQLRINYHPWNSDRIQHISGSAQLSSSRVELTLLGHFARDTKAQTDIEMQIYIDKNQHIKTTIYSDNITLISIDSLLTSTDTHWNLQADTRINLYTLQHFIERVNPTLTSAFTLSETAQLHSQLSLNLPHAIALDPESLIKQLHLQAQFDGQTEMQVNLSSTQEDLANTQHTAISLSGEAEWLNQHMSLQFDPQSAVELSLHTNSSRRLPTIKATLESPLTLSGAVDSWPNWTYSAHHWALSSKEMTLSPTLLVNSHPLQIRIAEGRFTDHHSLEFDLPHLLITQQNTRYPRLHITGALQSNPQATQIKLEANLSVDNIKRPVILRLELNDFNKGFLGYKINLSHTEIENGLHDLPLTKPQGLTLLDGQLSLTGRLQFSLPQWHLQSHLSLVNTSFEYNNTSVQPLNLHADIEFDNYLIVSVNGLAQPLTVNPGLPINLSSIGFHLTQSAHNRFLTLDAVQAGVLNGSIRIPSLYINLLEPEINTTAYINNIHLRDIFALYSNKGLEGEGLIHGELPIQFNAQGLRVTNGKLFSPSGLIQYSPDPSLEQGITTNRALSIALDAIKNLQYDLLELSLSYEPNGEVAVLSRIKGNNPNWQNGRPIDVNLTLEDNLHDLLRALQVSGKINDSIEQHFQQ